MGCICNTSRVKEETLKLECFPSKPVNFDRRIKTNMRLDS